jgi:hypothetical protein
VASKPVHDVVFHWGAHHTGPDPAAMRLPAFAGHLLALLFVHRLARQAGAPRRSALLAVLLYAAFATQRSLLWPVAVSGFLRVTFALAALSFFLDCREPVRALPAAAAVACTALALASHQSGALTPLWFVAWRALVDQPRLRDAPAAAWRSLRHPVVVAASLVVVAYVLWSLRAPDQYRSVREFGAIAANAVRALVALLPDLVREWIVAGLRGGGTAGRAAAGAGALLVIALHVTLFARGGAPWRFALLAGALDLGLAISVAGFSQRYAYLAAALAAVAFGWSHGRASPRGRRRLVAVAVALGACWVAEGVRVVRELRDAGEVAQGLLRQAEEAAARLPAGDVLVVANLPDVWGRGRDLPLFNWGFAPALRLRGTTRPIVEVRTGAARTSTAARQVPEAELDALRRASGTTVLEFDAGRRRFQVWRDGQPR